SDYNHRRAHGTPGHRGTSEFAGRWPHRRSGMQRRHLLQGAAARMALPRPARAQSSPVRSIRYIVPVAAGGGNDMIARVVTERWGRLLGQTFVVDNQSGGGGVVACLATARAAPDGYTLMQGYVATHGTTPATRPITYDAVKDF